MKLFCSLLLFLLLTAPCWAQTTYSHEINVRQGYAKRLKDQIKAWERREYVIETSEKEYQRCAAGKNYVDQKVRECIASNSCVELYTKLNPWGSNAQKPSIGKVQNSLSASLGLTIAGGQAPLKTYRDIETCISFYGQKLPPMRRELLQLKQKLKRARTDLQRIEDEIRRLKQGRSKRAGRSVFEGRWMLSGGGKSNVIEVRFNKTKQTYQGIVISSQNLLCHPNGALLFSVIQRSGYDNRFEGVEYGYDYKEATQECVSQQVPLGITVKGNTMIYNNGSYQITMTSVDSRRPHDGPDPPADWEPGERRRPGHDRPMSPSDLDRRPLDNSASDRGLFNSR